MTSKVAWWTRGDLNAFFGLGFNILVNVLTLTTLMIGVIKLPAGDVLGTVLPALGVALVLGNLYHTFLARRLAQREKGTDVTALPYGPSVPHMFIVVFVVMLPVYLATKDATASTGLFSRRAGPHPDRVELGRTKASRVVLQPEGPPQVSVGWAVVHRGRGERP